jgi:hypothetical protein
VVAEQSAQRGAVIYKSVSLCSLVVLLPGKQYEVTEYTGTVCVKLEIK